MNRRVLLFPSEIAQDVVQSGIRKAGLRLHKLIPLGILAGIFIAIGGLMSTTLRATFPPDQEHISTLLGASVFTIGIVLVVIAGGELYNGNILMFLARLDGKINTKRMLRNWAWVYLLNFIGVLLVVFISYKSGIYSDKMNDTLFEITQKKLSYSFITAFFRGVGCNILVCLSVWIAASANDTTGKIVASSFPVITFIFIGFEHAIANMFFFTSSYAASMGITVMEILVNNLIPVSIGNLVGGLLVAILYYFSYIFRE